MTAAQYRGSAAYAAFPLVLGTEPGLQTHSVAFLFPLGIFERQCPTMRRDKRKPSKAQLPPRQKVKSLPRYLVAVEGQSARMAHRRSQYPQGLSTAHAPNIRVARETRLVTRETMPPQKKRRIQGYKRADRSAERQLRSR